MGSRNKALNGLRRVINLLKGLNVDYVDPDIKSAYRLGLINDKVTRPRPIKVQFSSNSFKFSRTLTDEKAKILGKGFTNQKQCHEKNKKKGKRWDVSMWQVVQKELMSNLRIDHSR